MMRTESYIFSVAFFLFFVLVWPQGECFAPIIVDELGKLERNMRGDDTGAPGAPAETKPVQPPPPIEISEELPEPDEFYPGETLSQSTDEQTGNTTSLVKMPDGTVKIVERNSRGEIISEMELSREDAERILSGEEGVTTEIKKLPDGNIEVAQYDKDGNLIGREVLDESQMASVSTLDADSRLTTTTERNEDGSYTVTQTDEDGFVVSQETLPAEERQLASASSYDPETGITTTSMENPDGSHTVIKSRTWKDSEGRVHTAEIDNEGNRIDTVTTSDGITTITQTDAEGNSTEITTHKDGTVFSVEKDPDGSTIETTTTTDNNTYRVARDAEGNIVGSLTQYSDGSTTIVDSEEGIKLEISAPAADGTTTLVSTDEQGNQTVIIQDEDGFVLSRQGDNVTPMDPGEEYYRSVIRGDDWENLPQSVKTRYAQSERRRREVEETQELREAQAAEREAQAAIEAQWRAEQQEQLDVKLAQIEQERQEHLQRREELLAQQERETTRADLEFDRMEALERTGELQSQLDVAVADGDKKEIRRIEELMDEHSDETAHLFEFTGEEGAMAERYQQVRGEVRDEILRVARDGYGGTDIKARILREIEAAEAGDSTGEQLSRELTLQGMMIDQVDDDMVHQMGLWVQADNEVMAAQEYLQRGDLTPMQRNAAVQMLQTAYQRRAVADNAIDIDEALIDLGAAADLLTLYGGGVGARILRRFMPSLVKGGTRLEMYAGRRLGPKAAKGVKFGKELLTTPVPGAAGAGGKGLVTGADEAAAGVTPRPGSRASGVAAEGAAESATRRILAEGADPHATTIMESPAAVAEEAFRTAETDIMTPAETSHRPLRGGSEPAWPEPKGDYSFDLTTPEGRAAQEAFHAQMEAGIRQRRAAGTWESERYTGSSQPEPALSHRPGFKDVPPAVERPVTPWESLTPEELVRAEAETAAHPAVKSPETLATETPPSYGPPKGTPKVPEHPGGAAGESLEAIANEPMDSGPHGTQILPPSEAAGGRPPLSSRPASGGRRGARTPSEPEPEIQFLDEHGDVI
ncbi:MAG: hypothetical protein J3T61_07540, partial [Candidatus Brocadiales bacterium]|nr:hypothetical protein [Candidatus Bathyanammoxibius sp.]